MEANNRRPTLRHPNKDKKSKRQPTGHDVAISAAKRNGSEVMIALASGNTVSGKVSNFDNWTITLDHQELDPFDGEISEVATTTFFKHAIESFSVKTA